MPHPGLSVCRDAEPDGETMIVLIGDEPHAPYERPPLSKTMLTAAVEPAPAWFFPLARYAERDITLLTGRRVVAVEPSPHRVRFADGTALAYTRLLLATGGEARRLAIPGADEVLALRTLDEARALRPRLLPGARVVCIGGGVIGLEIAASARQRGCEVTVIEATGGVMGRLLAPEIAAVMEALHRRAGTVFHFNTAAVAIAQGRVTCGDGTVLEADLVIAGTGMRRTTDLAEAAGLACDNGILVDEHGRSSDPDIYAAGDVAAFWNARLGRRMRLETWRHAMNHGLATGRAMAGAAAPYDDIPWFWTDQHGVNLQMAGSLDGATRMVLRGALDAPSFAAFHLDAAGCVVAATGINAPREVRAGEMLIRAAVPVDAAALADPAIPPQRLAAARAVR
jgi:3-phenylpropionate/trans-cinnamate dioxygenase ferredoxin reductase subunit